MVEAGTVENTSEGGALVGGKSASMLMATPGAALGEATGVAGTAEAARVAGTAAVVGLVRRTLGRGGTGLPLPGLRCNVNGCFLLPIV